MRRRRRRRSRRGGFKRSRNVRRLKARNLRVGYRM